MEDAEVVDREGRRDGEDPSKNEWTLKDVWLGLLFLAAGILIVVYAIVVTRGPLPFLLRASAWIVGPLLMLLGLNAVVRSLGAGARKRSARDRPGGDRGRA
ncbi:MAG: hypothetical protein ACYTGC_15715 [Planctomycetota bacterium]|jgi:hypothetical protein